MNSQVSVDLVPGRPVGSMRITFWGVQGSCAIFPTPHGIADYSRRVSLHTLSRALADLQCKAAAGRCGVEQLLGGPATPANIEAYQERIGLPELPFYGGETTCVEVETSEGNMIVFDAGSGLRRCALGLINKQAGRPERTVHLFGTHEHLDHRSGLAYARFCYLPEYTIHMYGPHAFLRAVDTQYGIFSHEVSEATYTDDPVDWTMMPATFTATELKSERSAMHRKRAWPFRDLSPIRIGSTTVTPFELYHVQTVCLGYVVEHEGKKFVFATDHELRHDGKDVERQERSEAAEARLRGHCRNADLAYMDGQYFKEEYEGGQGIGSSPPVKRLDWGHSCVEDCIERAAKCNIPRTLIGHHDPERTWQERVEMDRHLRELCAGQPNEIRLADGEAVVDL